MVLTESFLDISGVFSEGEKMKPAHVRIQKRNGFALIVSMIFVLVFSAFAMAMFSASGTNMQIAGNQHKAGQAFANAESGLEVMRFWLNRIKMPASTPVEYYFPTILHDLREDLAVNEVTRLHPHYDGTIPAVDVQSGNGGTFSVEMHMDTTDPTVLQLSVTGSYEGINRTIRVNYNVAAYEYPIFNFGLATKGPLQFEGNPTLVGANAEWEADVFVESPSNAVALSVTGNTNFDGDITISNPSATVDFGADILIGGEQGQDAIDNHVSIGAEAPEFPIPDTDRFRAFATGDVIDATTDVNSSMTIVNGYIPAGTNPTFGGSVTIQGILFIEQPNIVNFTKNVDLQGMIVADGDIEAPGTNAINVQGNFGTGGYPAGAEFDAIRQEVGSSIVAPGFSASFTGNYATIEGVVAISGVEFSGNANAVVKGTIINYSDEPAVIEGNTMMTFDRSNSPTIPAGFDTHRILNYSPPSYSVIH